MTRTAARLAAGALAAVVLGMTTLAWPITDRSASAAPSAPLDRAPATAPLALGGQLPAQPAPPGPAAPGQEPTGLCSIEEWQADFRACTDRLQEVGAARASCLDPPTPVTPDSGLAGWFASRPDKEVEGGPRGLYTTYGNAGYGYETYDGDGGCASDVLDAGTNMWNQIADIEMMFATAIIGASNALRERAWDPGTMWSWADPLVEQATTAIYRKVFSVFGIITLCIVGLYLLWRSRQSDMSAAMTTAGWALLVMVAVTAIAAWPVKSANLADGTLTATLGVVHDAVGPRPADVPPEQCQAPDRNACTDQRPPALRASDTATETMLYRNWLRGTLGSADSETAKKYGRALYDAKAFSWVETERLRANPATRASMIEAKQGRWMKLAEQIRTEDPEAYEYLRGAQADDRIAAGFIAVMAALLYALFDMTASLLVLLGFLIFRWAVIAAPILGTIGLLRPASAGIRRLGNAVVAAVFNIAIFGTGAAVYLFAVDLIMSTPTLPAWLQVVLIWLCGVVGWLLLRPYKRITRLGGKDPSEVIGSAGSWHRRFFRDMRSAARLDPSDDREQQEQRTRVTVVNINRQRPETRSEDPVSMGDLRSERRESASSERDGRAVRPDGRERADDLLGTEGSSTAERTAPRPRSRPMEWTEPDVPAEQSSFVIYRPESVPAPEPEVRSAPPRVRSEAR